MRATIVTNWDRQELIIPNKNLVTGEVVNWTLSNAINRVVIPIRVPFGSDTDLVRDVIIKVANSHPRVMEEPAPLVTCDMFGEHALEFILRCFLPNMDNRLGTRHELYAEIHRALREAGIEIAVPRRDIFMHTVTQDPTQPGVGVSSNGDTTP